MLRIKMLYERKKTWIYTMEYVIVSILLLILVMLVDLDIAPIHHLLPRFLFTSTSLAQTILSTLAGSLLTITTFTFSTILVILSLYASNYSPNIVENFLKKKITMKVLGIYIGGFFYSITTLAFMRDSNKNQLVIAGMVAVFYSIFCIIYFIRFVHSVNHSLQIVNIVNDLYQDALSSIEQITKENEVKALDVTPCIENPHVLLCRTDGYLEGIDYDKIGQLLEGKSDIFIFKRFIGDFITEGDPLAIYHATKKEKIKELDDALLDQIIIQDEKIVLLDYHFGVQKLVEVALRAISPAINDPNTAIRCINKIGILLGKIAKINDNRVVEKVNGGCRIYYQDINFEKELHRSYEQLIQYGKSDISVVRALFQSFRTIYHHAPRTKRRLVQQFSDYTYNSVKMCFTNPEDVAQIEAFRINKRGAIAPIE